MRPYSYLILGVSPTSNEAQVELNEKIVIRFAKHIHQDTLNKNNIRLSVVNGEFLDYDGEYDAAEQTYTITPKEEFLPNTQYQTLVMGGKEGVMAIDNSYIPATKTYEFQTVVEEGDIEIQSLSLKQDLYFVSAEWSIPDGLVYGEEVYFNVRLSHSKEPMADDIWPKNPLEGKTTDLYFTIPYKVDLGQNYYVHVQAVRGENHSDWITAQLFMEKIADNTAGDTSSSKPEQDGVDPEFNMPITEQLAVIEHSPKLNELVIPEEIIVGFSHLIKPEQFNEEEETNPLFYVVAAPYKETLSMIDRMGAYSFKNALPGTITMSEEYPVLIWTPLQPLEADTNYTVILSKDIESTEHVFPLGHTFHFGFSGTPEHLHGEIEHIQEVLSGFGLNFSVPYLQSLMKKHSQFACDIWQETSGYDETLHQNGDAPYFIHGYVNTQVLIDALLRGGLVLHGSANESITLSELTVTKSGGRMAIGAMLDELRGQLKKWEDLIHDQHNRGYAKPSAVVKGEAVDPYPETLTRSELNTDFEE